MKTVHDKVKEAQDGYCTGISCLMFFCQIGCKKSREVNTETFLNSTDYKKYVIKSVLTY